MLQLMVLRHAKSSWSDGSLSDHERPLNERGRDAAAAMGRFMAEEDLLPDRILSSDSTRTRETVELWVEAAAWDGAIDFLPDLYHADVPTLLQVASLLPPTCRRPMLVAHNPGIAELVSLSSGTMVETPTGTLAVIDVELERWTEIARSRLRTVLTKRPRELTD